MPSGRTRAEEFPVDGRSDEALRILRRVWGYDAFRGGQSEIIEPLIRGRDVLAVLPTGAGKSLCYQIPALVRGGVTIVVSPLISLMEDQVQALTRRGVPAWSLSGVMTPSKMATVVEAAARSPAALLYVSPERLTSARFRSLVRALDVRLLAVDEAHCISEWGHDFRPPYGHIPSCYAAIDRPPVVALTATATPRVRRDIALSLKLETPRTHYGNLDRPGLVFSVMRTPAWRTRLGEILAAVPGTAVVYAPTRRAVEYIAGYLVTRGHEVRAYHAGFEGDRRADAQRDWMENRARIMVATNAFGMGIDKPDVRSVTHVGMPGSLEGYYQEAGRAGRDGARAYATLLFGEDDLRRARNRLRRLSTVRIRTPFGKVDTENRRRNRDRARLRPVLGYALSRACRRRSLLGHFGDFRFHDCGLCDVCLGRHEPFIPGPRWEREARRLLERLDRGDPPCEIGDSDSVPAYRTRQLLYYLVRQGYVAQGVQAGSAPRLTALGRDLIVPAESDCPARDCTDRRTGPGRPRTAPLPDQRPRR